jgi:hypothetical protein
VLFLGAGGVAWFLAIRRRQRATAADRILDHDSGTDPPLS